MSDSSSDEDEALLTQSVEEYDEDITFQKLVSILIVRSSIFCSLKLKQYLDDVVLVLLLELLSYTERFLPHHYLDVIQNAKLDGCLSRLKGVTDVLCEACDRLNWKKPTKVQTAALPHAFKKRDIIGLAETGELAFQIGEQFEALGASIGILIAVIVGGIDMVTQSLALAKRPHVIVATPGRLVDHLENTKGFNLRALKYLVMDEADRILNMDFEVELEKILKVAKLERASLNDPVRIEVNSKYQTVDKLKQYYIFIPYKYKEAYLVYILNEMAGQTAIIFCSTCVSALRTALMLRKLGFGAVPLHGQMSQAKRLGSLNKFKSKASTILVCTDVASRGLDIPHIDVVLNYDVPTQSKDYVHRVGRTARAGRSGIAVTFVTQYDVENDVMLLMERVDEAQKLAKREMKEMEEKKGRKRRFDDDDGDEVNDAEEGNAFRKKLNRRQKGIRNGRRKF
ncbi:putative ATP-dependent RNA helicase DDX47 [Dirofilaria immitis]|nr:putative ATP-dependent RNA helicase DDX47 [Dirofilaria immitis]